mgnify:CR=1 FL=1
MRMVWILVSPHPLIEVISVTVLIPEVLYIIPIGFCVTEVGGAEPLPNVHAYVAPEDVPVF